MERYDEELENQHPLNGYEEVEEEEEEDQEEYEERGGGGRDRRRDGEEIGVGIGSVDGGESAAGGAASSSDASLGKIFVGGVAWDTTEESFASHFGKYGALVDSVIMKDKHTRAPRGFGFVTFADPSVIDKVLEDEHLIDGRTVEVKRTVPREEMSSKDGPKTRKIFVGGIPPALTEDDLKEHFSVYGKVVEHQIMLDHSTGRSRGFGFVTFESEDAVEKVISEGRMHDLGGKQVEIKKAEPKKHGGGGGDPGMNGRSSHGGGNFRGPYRGSGSGSGSGGGSGSGSAYGYGAGYRSGGSGGGYGSSGYGNSGYGNSAYASSAYANAAAYGAAGYGYGRGSYGYGANAGYGSGFGAGYGQSMYGGAYGPYGAYGPGAYGNPAAAYGGYDAAYGAGAGAGSGSGSGSGRGYGSGRYHPYAK